MTCPLACNSGVHVRGWAVWRNLPVSLVPRIVGFDPDPEKEGNRLVGVYPISFFVWSFLGYAFFRVFRFTLQGY
jgi:hypothetical protein